MEPQIYMYKGFVMFKPGDNQVLYNKLHESVFLEKNPNKQEFYCLANNAGLSFLKAYEKYFRKYYQFTDDIEKFLKNKSIQYVPHRAKNLTVPTFEGITWKNHQKIALDLISKYKRYCIFL